MSRPRIDDPVLPEELIPTPTGKLQILEVVCGIAFVLDGVIIPGLNFAVSLAAVALLCVVGLTRPVKHALSQWRWVFVVLFLVLFYVTLISATAPPTAYASDWTRRIIRIVAIVVLALLMAQGRVDTESLIKGAAIGLLINVPAFYLGLTARNYGNALAGFLEDKNKAGLFYCVVGLLLLAYLRKAWTAIATVLAFAMCLWLTESRTSMTAFAFGVLWMWLIARRSLAARWLAFGVAYWAVQSLENNFAQAGVFENRWGSDLLRGRIDAATAIKLAAAPWWGQGLGNAYVVIENRQWFFHNSYSTLMIEGGWIYAGPVVAISILVGLRPFITQMFNRRETAAQGTALAILICSLRLGEVMVTLCWALLIGAAVHAALTSADRLPDRTRMVL